MDAEGSKLRTTLAARYRIEREVGRGGMATVYRAQDLRHDRAVAIKVLRPEVAAAFGPERFLREIRTTARLDHPHILSLLDSGEAGDQLYYVMPYVEGESLRDRLSREGQLPLEDVLSIGRQVGSALDHAHQFGIVHRDIKPENILLAGGHARVADFGIARVAAAAEGEALTQTGVAIGTPAYMSPEQATGAPDVDARTDIYSLACVLYEMLVGEAPFTGPTPQAVLVRKLQQPMPHISLVRPTLPQGIDAVLERALAAAPADRYASAQQLVEALDRAAAPDQARERAAMNGTFRRRVISAGAMVVTLGVLATWWSTRTPNGKASGLESLVILPLDNLTGDSAQAFFVDGMHEALTAELSQISALKVISRTSAMRYRGTDKPAPQIARELGVDGLIEGSVAREGDRVRITVQLIHAPTDRHLWARVFDRELRGILALYTEVARAIADEIETTVTPQERVRLGVARSVDPRAFELYLLGRYQWNQRTLQRTKQAVENFLLAVDRDTAYAPAYAALGDTYLWLAEQGGVPQREGCALADAAIRRAIALDESLAEAHVARGTWQVNCGWNWREGDREFERAVALNPGSAAAHQFYGRSARVTGRLDAALVQLQRARELDPLSATIRAYLAQTHIFARRYDQAAATLLEALEVNPDHALLLHNLGELSLARSDWPEAVAYLERSVAGPGEQSAHYIAMLGSAYARAGRTMDAVRILDELERRASRDLASAFDIAALNVALGRNAEAMSWLERGYARKDYWLPELKAWPWFDPLRSDPRFEELVRKLGLP